MEPYTLIRNDSLIVLPTFDENSVDACITDPPYGMNIASWDKALPNKQIWKELYRVLKPGSFLLSFCSPKNYHRLACDIEDSGFLINDMMFWMTTTKLAKRNALKPAHEPICVAQKKREGTIEENFSKWGTGIVNLNECRVPWEGEPPKSWVADGFKRIAFGDTKKNTKAKTKQTVSADTRGRLPTTIVGIVSPTHQKFFYNPEWTADDNEYLVYYFSGRSTRSERGDDNFHATPKPVALMRYLIKLYSPENGCVLDPFSGSGSTGLGAIRESRRYIGIELNEDYHSIAINRLSNMGILPI